jgi:hypothetical protein
MFLSYITREANIFHDINPSYSPGKLLLKGVKTKYRGSYAEVSRTRNSHAGKAISGKTCTVPVTLSFPQSLHLSQTMGKLLISLARWRNQLSRGVTLQKF